MNAQARAIPSAARGAPHRRHGDLGRRGREAHAPADAGAAAPPRSLPQPLYLDLQLPAGASFAQALPADHNAFVYVYQGGMRNAGESVPVKRMAILANEAGSDGVVIHAAHASKCLLVAGRPLNEPIAQYGPFVMNTEQEIEQALVDCRAGRLG